MKANHPSLHTHTVTGVGKPLWVSASYHTPQAPKHRSYFTIVSGTLIFTFSQATEIFPLLLLPVGSMKY